MNRVEGMLTDELARMIDRLAAASPPGTVATIARTPALRASAEVAEAALAAAYVSLGEHYARFGRALQDLEDVWSLAAWKLEQSPRDPTTPLAA